ncbi:hypothetical protein DB31_1023 [Hyalangium minutum]|uniref:Uncharacterized protein n=1 Tax=Hyalangium minutum TaxID=394096 RepID=A0A085WFT7_9BACT|nr:hypothetical protein DB31_1023 [Hyalangium minutum]
MSLSARMGTFAQIGEQQVPILVLQGEGRPESIQPTLRLKTAKRLLI